MGRFGLVGIRRGGGYDVSVSSGWQGDLIIVSAAVVSNKDGSYFFMLLKFFVAL